MEIKKVLYIIVGIAMLTACRSQQSKEKEEHQKPVKSTGTNVTRFEEIKGYFIKNDVTFDGDFKFVTAINKEQFYKYFGIAKTMNNEVTPLNFDKFNVAGILLKPSEKSVKIELTKFTAKGKKQSVGFKVVKGDPQTYSSGGLLLFKIPKGKTVVEFISEDSTATVEVK